MSEDGNHREDKPSNILQFTGQVRSKRALLSDQIAELSDALRKDISIFREELETLPDSYDLQEIRDTVNARKPVLYALGKLEQNCVSISDLMIRCNYNQAEALDIFRSTRFHEGLGVLKGIATYMDEHVGNEAGSTIASRVDEVIAALREYAREVQQMTPEKDGKGR